MFNIIIKTFLIYIFIVAAMRLMGKKQASQLQPFELVITLIIAEVASTPMNSPGTPMLYGLVPATTLLLVYCALTFLCRKSRRLRLLLCGKPNILIRDGRLCAGELKRIGYSLDDLAEQLRIAGETNIEDIHYAILETNGQMSVLLHADGCPLTPRDIGITSSGETLYWAMALDGRARPDGMAHFGTDPQRLKKTLHTLGFADLSRVFYFSLSDTGDYFIQDADGRVKTGRLPGESVHHG